MYSAAAHSLINEKVFSFMSVDIDLHFQVRLNLGPGHQRTQPCHSLLSCGDDHHSSALTSYSLFPTLFASTPAWNELFFSCIALSLSSSKMLPSPNLRVQHAIQFQLEQSPSETGLFSFLCRLEYCPVTFFSHIENINNHISFRRFLLVHRNLAQQKLRTTIIQ